MSWNLKILIIYFLKIFIKSIKKSLKIVILTVRAVQQLFGLRSQIVQYLCKELITMKKIIIID
jgi:hypothetical protein